MNENKNKVINYAQDFGALIALILLVAGISIASPSFRTGANFLSLLRQSSINGLIAFGMTFVILTDAIDLSVGSVLALSTALCAGMISAGVPAGLAMILALVLGCSMGVISGVMVTKGRLQPFIATLITMTVYRGLTMIYTNGKPISNLGDSFILKVVGKGKFYGVPIPVILLILLFLLLRTQDLRHRKQLEIRQAGWGKHTQDKDHRLCHIRHHGGIIRTDSALQTWLRAAYPWKRL